VSFLHSLFPTEAVAPLIGMVFLRPGFQVSDVEILYWAFT
jgi:hypothetical protein